MEQLVQILQGHSMRDILVKITDNQELESVIPIDRVVTIDSNNVVYLQDKAYIIEEKYIDKEL
jgi:hypothetical protein